MDNNPDNAADGLGEDAPPFALLCRECEDFKSSHPSANVQQQANMIMTAVVHQLMMEPRNPLSESGAPLMSQVSREEYSFLSKYCHEWWSETYKRIISYKIMSFINHQ